MTTSTLTWLRLYAIAGILHLLLLLADHWQGLYASKCVLMPLLVGAVWAARGYLPYRVCVFLSLALFFSWIGDIILMLAAPQAQGQFLAGLVAFLLAHLLYIATFRTEIALSGGTTSVRRTVIALLPLAGCIVLLLYTLRETLSHNGMWLPVGLYASIICAMWLAAFQRYGHVSQRGFWFALLGATLFILSDSMIAIARFGAPFAYYRAFIMLTYIAAQGLIVTGILYTWQQKVKV